MSGAIIGGSFGLEAVEAVIPKLQLRATRKRCVHPHHQAAAQTGYEPILRISRQGMAHQSPWHSYVHSILPETLSPWTFPLAKVAGGEACSIAF
jgi:hypothetical protein